MIGERCTHAPAPTRAHTHTQTKTDGPKQEKCECVKLKADLLQQWKAKAPSCCVVWLAKTRQAHWWRAVTQNLCDSNENPPTAYRSVSPEMLDGRRTSMLELKVNEGQKVSKWTVYRGKTILFWLNEMKKTWWNLCCVLQCEGELAGIRISPPGIGKVSAADLERRSVFPSTWQQTADGSALVIIALVASVFDYHCLSDLGAITVVFASFLMAASHVEQFVFLTGVCHGALSMCKHFRCSVCRRGGVCDYW